MSDTGNLRGIHDGRTLFAGVNFLVLPAGRANVVAKRGTASIFDSKGGTSYGRLLVIPTTCCFLLAVGLIVSCVSFLEGRRGVLVRWRVNFGRLNRGWCLESHYFPYLVRKAEAHFVVKGSAGSLNWIVPGGTLQMFVRIWISAETAARKFLRVWIWGCRWLVTHSNRLGVRTS